MPLTANYSAGPRSPADSLYDVGYERLAVAILREAVVDREWYWLQGRWAGLLIEGLGMGQERFLEKLAAQRPVGAVARQGSRGKSGLQNNR